MHGILAYRPNKNRDIWNGLHKYFTHSDTEWILVLWERYYHQMHRCDFSFHSNKRHMLNLCSCAKRRLSATIFVWSILYSNFRMDSLQFIFYWFDWERTILVFDDTVFLVIIAHWFARYRLFGMGAYVRLSPSAWSLCSFYHGILGNALISVPKCKFDIWKDIERNN